MIVRTVTLYLCLYWYHNRRVISDDKQGLAFMVDSLSIAQIYLQFRITNSASTKRIIRKGFLRPCDC